MSDIERIVVFCAAFGYFINYAASKSGFTLGSLCASILAALSFFFMCRAVYRAVREEFFND